MKLRVRSLALVLFVLFFGGSAYAQTFVANMTGAQEVPPADPDGTGTATIWIVGTTVHYQITVANIDPPTMQHIHQGAAGVNGPIVVNLPGVWVGNTLTGTTTTDSATAAAIIANPAGFYVNVHNGPFSGGAIRGQLGLAGVIPTASTIGLIVLGMAIALGALLVLRRT